jgi:hypothetical protein
MLESAIGLLSALFLTALTLVIGFCIVGSIVAALRAVSRGSSTVSARSEGDLRFRDECNGKTAFGLRPHATIRIE